MHYTSELTLNCTLCRVHKTCCCLQSFCPEVRRHHQLSDKLVIFPAPGSSEFLTWVSLLGLDQTVSKSSKVWVGRFKIADLSFAEDGKYAGIARGTTRHRGYGRGSANSRAPPRPTATSLEIRESCLFNDPSTASRRRSSSSLSLRTSLEAPPKRRQGYGIRLSSIIEPGKVLAAARPETEDGLEFAEVRATPAALPAAFVLEGSQLDEMSRTLFVWRGPLCFCPPRGEAWQPPPQFRSWHAAHQQTGTTMETWMGLLRQFPQLLY
ncbi:hypothetical protein B484DRAFT_460024 [Ochromonadaceae sp. CCMP2298]|nr:hypothetical protein B484DRAFT_460024 [Ochromonadaceae sp. CCMP2298]